MIGITFRVKPTIMTELYESKLFGKNKNKNEIILTITVLPVLLIWFLYLHLS